MSKSKAKKHREKRVREGKRNPALNRGVYAMADLATRKTKTKQESIQRQKHRRFDESDDVFLVWLKISLNHIKFPCFWTNYKPVNRYIFRQ